VIKRTPAPGIMMRPWPALNHAAHSSTANLEGQYSTRTMK